MGVETAGLVLAAGGGRRYGMPKALVPWGGRLLVQHAADTLRAAGVTSVVVVLGAQADRVRAAAPDLPHIVVNPDWQSGLASSLRLGLHAVSGTPATAVVVLLVDMPGVTPSAVRRVAAAASPDALAMGGYADRRGHPVLLGRAHWPGISATASGDHGARTYLRAHADEVRVIPLGDIADDADLDYPPTTRSAARLDAPGAAAHGCGAARSDAPAAPREAGGSSRRLSALDGPIRPRA